MSLVMRNLIVSYANNKDADQPVHPRCLISVFIVCYLDIIIYLVSTSKLKYFAPENAVYGSVAGVYKLFLISAGVDLL